MKDRVGMTDPEKLSAPALTRRTLMQRAMLVAIASGAITTGCSSGGDNEGPMSERDLLALKQVSDVMIPATETPGAIETRVPDVIAVLLENIYSNEARRRTEKALRALPKLADRDGVLLPDATQILSAYDAKAFSDKPNYLYRDLKRLIFDTYFTSEIGGTEVLLYDPFPGAYRGCVPYSEIGGTWL